MRLLQVLRQIFREQFKCFSCVGEFLAYIIDVVKETPFSGATKA